MACVVVYGTTEELGLIATDAGMVSGAHAEHQVELFGLHPGTVYFYRVQGSAEDGGLYRSALTTFRTSDRPDLPGTNVAFGAAIIDVSSEFSDTFDARNATDGDPTTEWSSNGDGDDASITIDLGTPTDVVGVGFRSREMSDGTSLITSYTLTVDNTRTFGPFDAGSGLAIVELAFRGQVLRFDAETTTGGNTGAVEIEIYA